MIQSKRSIKRTLKELRKIIDDKTTDVETRRMAYFAENTLRWATEETVSWQRPEDDLQDEVFLLKQELAARSTTDQQGTDGQTPPTMIG